MKKEAQVIMLPTDIIGTICIRHDKPKILLQCKYVVSPVILTTHNHYELYIVDDSEIKEDDWVVYLSSKIPKVHKINKIDSTFERQRDECKKIISTTDSNLRINKGDYNEQKGKILELLPQPSQQFIQEYCEKGGIDKLLIEYKGVCSNCNEYHKDSVLCMDTFTGEYDYKKEPFKLEINSNNTINILPIKEKLYTEKEVYEKMVASWIYGEANHGEHYSVRENWIKENL
jgi:hypothetical protein